MADFIVTHRPEEVEVAYGPIIVTTYDNDTDGFVHALKVYDTAGTTIAFLQQSPNPVGYAHFDISKVLQRQIGFNPQLELIGDWKAHAPNVLADSSNEALEYEIGYGYIDANGTYQETAVLSGSAIPSQDEGFRVIYGRKTFNEVDWDRTPYIPSMSCINACSENVAESYGAPLTDRNYDVVLPSELSGVVPTRISSDQQVYKFTRRRDDDLTISYLNQWTGSVEADFTGIAGFFYDVYNSSGTKLVTAFERNLISNGGGPNTTANGDIEPTGSFVGISAPAGNNYLELTGSDVAYYYVTPYAHKYDPDVTPGNIYPYNPIRVDIDNSGCSAGYTPIQVSWVNSFGYKDYFTFEAKNEKRTRVERKTFNRTFADWSEATYAPSIYDRGESIYGMTLTDSYEANTRFLSEDEMNYLRNLIVSSEVKIRFEDTNDWLPVVLETAGWVERNHTKDGTFQLQITFRLANKPIIQNG